MKKVIRILALIMLICTILKIGDTYAKYFTKANTGNLTQDIGKWVIKLNNMDIYSEDGESVEFTIDKLTDFSNPNATSNKISPSSTGYASIIIDPTGTDVAVRYDIELDPTQVEDIQIKVSAEAMPEKTALVRTGENTYTGIIPLSEVQAGDTTEVRCAITWENNEAQNDIDSNVGTVENAPKVNINIPVKVTVTQYLGEELTEYKGA